VSDERAPEARWPPWYGPLALVIGLLTGVLGGSIVASVLPHGISGGSLSPAATDLATLIQDLSFVVAAVFLAARIAPPRPRQFGWRRPRSLWQAVAIVPAALLFVSLLAYIWFAALDTSGQEKEFVKEIGGNAGTLSVLAVCALTCVVAPICEETLFRGFMFRSLENWRGPWPAALATGVLFGLVHGLSAPAADLVPLALLGIVLCFVYLATASIYPCIAIHMINNALALGSDESWGAGRVVALMAGALAIGALVLVVVRIASNRWMPATG
jgi:membrane protease YdiL (CAAX protease family)